MTTDTTRPGDGGRVSDLRVLSLGAGVQSSTLLLMALDGEIERPDCAIFADTQWEPAAVYRHLDWLQERADAAGLPLYRVTVGNIRKHIERSKAGYTFRSIPLFVRNKVGERGQLRRQCTKHYKVEPITKKIRELLGYRPRQPVRHVVERWQGISLDEVYRMRTSREIWCVNRYPLIDARMSRWDCLLWMRARGYPDPPKSACIGCPYHSNSYWRQMRDTAPDEWAEATRFDDEIRHGLRGVEMPAFVHSSLKPLAEVDLSTLRERGQLEMFDDFNAECEGMCGV